MLPGGEAGFSAVPQPWDRDLGGLGWKVQRQHEVLHTLQPSPLELSPVQISLQQPRSQLPDTRLENSN